MSDNSPIFNLWVEKYRPKSLDEIVLDDKLKEIFSKYIEQKSIPNLLFYGGPGSGKTSIARILIDNIIEDDNDVLIKNGSTENGVDLVRNSYSDFMSTPSMGNTIKIIFVDESDHMTSAAQGALRHIIEKYEQNGRFIFTCNYISKISKEIRSRFQEFKFNNLPKNFIKKNCIKILKSENVDFSEEILDKIINSNYPDFRKILNILQPRSSNGTLSLTVEDVEYYENEIEKNLYNCIQGILKASSVKNYFQNILSILESNEVNYIDLYNKLFSSDVIPIWAKITINDYANKHSQGILIPEMNFIACVYKIINDAKQLRLAEKK